MAKTYSHTLAYDHMRPRTRPVFQINRHAHWIDVLLVAAIIGAVLFNQVVGPLTPLTIIGSVGVFILIRWERLFSLFVSCWPLLLLPSFVLTSALWSEVPGTTLYYGILYLLTALAGIFMGGGMSKGSFLQGAFYAYALYTVLSFLSFRWVDWNNGGMAFAGLAGSKNAAGDMAGLALVICTCFGFWALYMKKYIQVAMAIAVLPFALFILHYSHATGALIATFVALICLGGWILSRRFGRQFRATFFFGGITLTLCLLLSMQWWLPTVFEAVLEGSGKDSGLTGRVDLWRFAHTLIDRQPWLGLSYNGFWLHNNLDAEYLWRLMGITTRMGFNFHNTFLELVVHLGYIGFALFALVAFIGAFKLATIAMLEASYEKIMACALLVFFLPKTYFEVIAFGNMHFSTLIVYAFLAMGYRGNERNSAHPLRHTLR